MWLLSLPSVAGAYRAGVVRASTHHSRSGLLTCGVGTQAHSAGYYPLHRAGLTNYPPLNDR